MLRGLVLLLALAAAAPARADLEVIPLRHRTVEQVLPVLRPLLAPGGALSGQYHQLIVRTTPENLAELRRVLEAIDTPQRRLTILVRFESAAEAAQGALGAQVDIRAGGPDAGARVGVQASEARSSLGERVDQRIAVLEGARAFIATGASRPLTERRIVHTPTGTVVTETTALQEAQTGFDVVPRVSGDAVTLDIAPRRQNFAGGAGALQGEAVATTLRARLGEWVEIGASTSARAQASSGLAASTQARASDARRVWVRVDEARP